MDAGYPTHWQLNLKGERAVKNDGFFWMDKAKINGKGISIHSKRTITPEQSI